MHDQHDDADGADGVSEDEAFKEVGEGPTFDEGRPFAGKKN